jgi:hypothetical protein
MSAEWVTAIATSVTALVIASSAAAALFQLRHMRGSNQIVALTELRETLRRLISGPGLYENFEYLVRLTEEFLAKHPHGTLSARFERKMPAYVWPESAEYVKN